MNAEWVTRIQQQCRKAKVPFFFKQWGGVRKSATGRELNGRTYDEYPLLSPSPVLSAAARRELVEGFQASWPQGPRQKNKQTV